MLNGIRLSVLETRYVLAKMSIEIPIQILTTLQLTTCSKREVRRNHENLMNVISNKM